MEFVRLSEADQVAALTRLGREALRAWDLGAAAVELLKYRENAVFRVIAAGGERTILRVHRPGYRSDDEIRSEIAWRHALDEAGIDNPTAIPSRDGAYVVTAAAEGVPEPRQCDLMRWIPGLAPGTLEGGVTGSEEELRALYRRVGGLAVRLERHAARWTKPAGFSRPRWDTAALVGEAPAFGRFWELEEIDAEQMRVLLAARDRAQARLSQLEPAAVLIHGDLVPDNILMDGSALRVIDFDDCGWSWPGLEMATSLFPLRVSGGFDAGLAGYLEGYGELCTFPERELDLLPDLLMARALSYLGWPAGRREIESTRQMVPMLVFMVAEAAREYLRR